MFEYVVTPFWIRYAIPGVTWRKNARRGKSAEHESAVEGSAVEKSAADKSVYLTFDDGPTAELTLQLLDLLEQFNAGATFFCIGENVEKYPTQFRAIVDRGHSIGNHSHTHPNGWQTGTARYVQDIARAQQTITRAAGSAPRMFRPPFGRIGIRQWWQLKAEYELVLWDILSKDYRPEVSSDAMAGNVIDNARAGSIVLLHDSTLTAQCVLKGLPAILESFTERGFTMRAL